MKMHPVLPRTHAQCADFFMEDAIGTMLWRTACPQNNYPESFVVQTFKQSVVIVQASRANFFDGDNF